MKKQIVYCTHRMYSASGKRMSIFAEKLNDTSLIVSYLFISQKDTINKKLSWKVWRLHNSGVPGDRIKEQTGVTLHHMIVPIDGYAPRKEFLQWARDNFYSFVTIAKPVRKLVRANDVEYYQIMNKQFIKK